MPISVKCPKCGDKRSIPDDFGETKVRCKSCGASFRVDGPSSGDGDDDEPPRRRDESGEARSRSRRERNEDDDARPRRKGSKKAKITVAYVLGLLVALVFLAGAVGFLAWRAGVFQPKTEPKEKVQDDGKEPEYTAPDPRIGALRKETIGDDGERVAGNLRIRLALDSDEAGAERHKVVLSFQVTSGPRLGANDRLVVMHTDRMVVFKINPQLADGDPRQGNYTLSLPEESRRSIKKVWIASVPADALDVKATGIRVSNVVILP
jgi:hypothetical protein